MVRLKEAVCCRSFDRDESKQVQEVFGPFLGIVALFIFIELFIG